jgi:hypothetical protein
LKVITRTAADNGLTQISVRHAITCLTLSVRHHRSLSTALYEVTADLHTQSGLGFNAIQIGTSFRRHARRITARQGATDIFFAPRVWCRHPTSVCTVFGTRVDEFISNLATDLCAINFRNCLASAALTGHSVGHFIIPVCGTAHHLAEASISNHTLPLCTLGMA